MYIDVQYTQYLQQTLVLYPGDRYFFILKTERSYKSRQLGFLRPSIRYYLRGIIVIVKVFFYLFCLTRHYLTRYCLIRHCLTRYYLTRHCLTRHCLTRQLLTEQLDRNVRKLYINLYQRLVILLGLLELLEIGFDIAIIVGFEYKMLQLQINLFRVEFRVEFQTEFSSIILAIITRYACLYRLILTC